MRDKKEATKMMKDHESRSLMSFNLENTKHTGLWTIDKYGNIKPLILPKELKK
jgi:hypothetical protein